MESMLTGKQKRFLRAMGSELDPVVHIGKSGIDGAVISGTQEALTARELIKVRVLRNCPDEPASAMSELAGVLRAELVQIIGRNGLLYKKNVNKPKIELP